MTAPPVLEQRSRNQKRYQRVADRVGVQLTSFLRSLAHMATGSQSQSQSYSQSYGLLPERRSVRIMGCGTLFVVNELAMDAFPVEGTASRARGVTRTRGGPAANVLSLISQLGRTEHPRGHVFPAPQGNGFLTEPVVDPYLIAALGSDDVAAIQKNELASEGVSTRYCKTVEGAPAPSSWVFVNDAQPSSTTVVHHNSLPNISHIEFVELLGPLLVPENYPAHSSSSPPRQYTSPAVPMPRPSTSSDRTVGPPVVMRRSPFDVIVFEGRDPAQTLQHMTAIDSIARERGWRSRCALCLDLSRKDRTGMDALIRQADIVLFSKAFARAQNFDAPRTFLLSMVSLAAPHALLVVNWGDAGAAMLSMPTREYFQASGWTESEADKRIPVQPPRARQQTRAIPTPRGKSHSRSRPKASTSRAGAVQAPLPMQMHIPMSPTPTSPTSPSASTSIRSGSHFWADGRGTPSTGTGAESNGRLGLRDWDLDPQGKRSEEIWRRTMRQQDGLAYLDGPESPRAADGSLAPGDGDDDDDARTEQDYREPGTSRAQDEGGAHAAFVAGLLYTLTKRLVPGPPFAPQSDFASGPPRDGPWRMEDCLKFATELAGRKARRSPGAYDGLAREMRRAGWFGST